jgi:hypothetical protein
MVFSTYYYSDKINKCEVGETYSTYEGNEKFIIFDGEHEGFFVRIKRR